MRRKNHLESGTGDGFRRSSSKKWPRESEDMRRVKKVRFADAETVYPLCRKDYACSINAEEPLLSRCADPKTSEYAFYRKLREDAGHNFHSYQLLRHGNKQKKSEGNVHVRELDKVIEIDHEKFRSLFPLEIATPSELKCHSPSQAPMEAGLDKPDEGIFSRKRRRLRQLAAASLNLDIDKCQFKGCDLVSILLQRLVPECDASSSNSCLEREPRSRHALEDKCVCFEETPFDVSYLKNSSPDCLLNRESVFSQLDNVNSEFLLTGSHEKLLVPYGRKPEDCMDFGRAPCLHSYQRSHPSTEFSFPSHGYITLNNNLTPSRLVYSTCKNFIPYGELPETSLSLRIYETLDELHDANKPEIRRGGCASQVSDWDNRIKNEERSLILSDNEAVDLNINWRIPIQNWEAQAEPLRLCSESALATWPCTDINMCNFYSASCTMTSTDVTVRERVNEKSCQLVEPDSLTSSPCNLNSFRTLGESSWLRSKHERSTYCSPHCRYKCMNELFEEKLPTDTNSLSLYSRHDIDLGWKSLPISDSTANHPSFACFSIQTLIKDIPMLTGDITDARLGSLSKSTAEVQLALSPLSFRVTLDEKRSRPLLLDKSSWDRSSGAALCDSEDRWTE